MWYAFVRLVEPIEPAKLVEFRARGMPVYGVEGGWGVSPDDERAHGRDERIPVQSLWDDVYHWESMVRDLAG